MTVDRIPWPVAAAYISPAWARRELPLAIRRLDGVLFIVVIALGCEALARSGGANLGWMIVYAYVSLRICADLGRFSEAFFRNQALFLFAYLTILSALWSDQSAITMLAGFQLLATLIIGFSFGLWLTPERLVPLALLGFSMLTILSAFAVLFTNPSNHDGYLIGIFAQKNRLAQMLGYCVLFAAIMMTMSRNRGLKAALFGLIGLGFAMIFAANSITSGFMTAGILGAMLLFSPMSVGRRLGASALLLALSLGAVLLFIREGVDFGRVLGQFGRDDTLTGRTEIWQIGLTLINEAPILGRGYFGFWQNPNFLGEIEWLRAAYGANINGFHNNLIEVAVSLGLIGLSLYGLMLAVVALRLIHIMRRSPRQQIWRGLGFVACYALGLSLFGPTLYRPHEIGLIIIALIAAQVTCATPQHQGPSW